MSLKVESRTYSSQSYARIEELDIQDLCIDLNACGSYEHSECHVLLDQVIYNATLS